MLKSYLAGIMIGISAYGYIVIENKFIGAFLFSFGLLTILVSQYKLYTGKIYCVQANIQNIIEKIIILFGNILGVISMTLIYCLNNRPNIDKLNSIVYNKLNQSVITFFFMGIVCGILMYLAVSQYNKINKEIFVIMPIMLFILIGAEHCIANLFYFICSDYIGIKAFIYFIINIVSNSIGSIIFYHLSLSSKECCLSAN